MTGYLLISDCDEQTWFKSSMGQKPGGIFRESQQSVCLSLVSLPSCFSLIHPLPFQLPNTCLERVSAPTTTTKKKKKKKGWEDDSPIVLSLSFSRRHPLLLLVLLPFSDILCLFPL
ncbi:hypothetical protein MLD38_039838 [Melastoma candidum]|uniref:Uncharacterized protein n=1 Tax=Melastoma candidum TaxID=119954 RepID=A0ACB9L3T5_9MYRT|nr:hypothetical protein MLD38_039838 [Melastoma candidum]